MKSNIQIEKRIKNLSKLHNELKLEYAGVRNKGSLVNRERTRIENHLYDTLQQIKQLSWVLGVSYKNFLM